MLICTAVALYAVLVISYALFHMLATDLLRRVLMASVAGVRTEVVAHVAGGASCVVVLVQQEILVVLERRRLPMGLGVALAAIAGDLLMQCVSRRFVAGLALICSRFLQQSVVKIAGQMKLAYSCVVRVAGNTIHFGKLLVERCFCQRLENLGPRRGQQTNVSGLVAGLTFF